MISMHAEIHRPCTQQYTNLSPLYEVDFETSFGIVLLLYAVRWLLLRWQFVLR